MKSFDFSRFALSISAAAAFLAGCGGSQPPIGAPGAMPQSRAIATRAQRGGSWMLPESSKQSLLYVADYRANAVYAYSYPKGKSAGAITGISGPDSVCVDKSGNIWVTNQGGTILEYAHGGTSPIKSLSDPSQYQGACSVDPLTGNLAVVDSYSPSGSGEVLIFKNASGMPTRYVTPLITHYAGAGYDTKGNLFVDGITDSAHFNLVELSKGANAFKGITLTKTGGPEPSGVQWIGTYLAVGFSTNGGSGHSVIWQLKIAKHTGTLLGKTTLEPAAAIEGFFIQDSTLVAPEDTAVFFFKYPAGGFPTKMIGEFELPGGIVVSVAPTRSRIFRR
jgi:hypothetical protein